MIKTPRLCWFTALLLLVSAGPVHAVKDGDVFKDWRAKCVTANDQTQPSCHIFQDLLQKESGKRVLHIAIGELSSQPTMAVIVTLPLGISLPPGIRIRVDQQDARQIPLQACFANGCQAAFELDKQWHKQLTAGNTAEVVFYNLHNQPISIPVSLKGISAALKALKAK